MNGRYPQEDRGQPKEKIQQVGAMFDGTPIYRLYYAGDPACHIGLLKEDVAPEAITATGGIDVIRATARAVEAA